MTEMVFISPLKNCISCRNISKENSRESSLDYPRYIYTLDIAKAGGTILDVIIPEHGITLNFISSVN